MVLVGREVAAVKNEHLLQHGARLEGVFWPRPAAVSVFPPSGSAGTQSVLAVLAAIDDSLSMSQCSRRVQCLLKSRTIPVDMVCPHAGAWNVLRILLGFDNLLSGRGPSGR